MNGVPKQLSVLRNFVRETWWMARRYADGRSTYAPSMFNEALLDLHKAGLADLVEGIANEPIYARDGMYGEWNPENRMFKGAPTKEQEGSAYHISLAENERDKRGLVLWKNKKTDKAYHVITMARDANEGPHEGTSVVVYFDELYVYVMDEEEFMDKFER